MNVMLHYRASPGFRAALEAMRPKDIVLTVVDETDEDSFRKVLADTAVILHVLRPLTADDIAAAKDLRLIQKIGVGVNTIDLQAARASEVAVCNMPGTNSQAVAELALMLMLGALRGISYFDPLTRHGEGWRPQASVFDRVGEISGRSVGFVGFGAVPRLMAPALKALGAKLFYAARTAKEFVGAQHLPLDDLLGCCDIVSLHCPITTETIGMISRGAIARMKPGTILINTARGELVDEAALVEALQTGHIRAAGLDVFAHEPLTRDSPLFGLSNVVLTPHLGWLTPETLERSIAVAFENCRRISTGENLLHRVV